MSEKPSRSHNRRVDQLRPLRFTPGFISKASGSCLVEMGQTRVICTASFSPGVPEWRVASGQGWLTAEYGMLPASGGGRKSRPGVKPDGRSVEIQRLIGRVIRTVIRFDKLGVNTIYLDCDVIEADGGTRTAAVNGAYLALAQAVGRAAKAGKCDPKALSGAVAAVSVGIVAGRCLLDLDYREDSSADVDMNLAMTHAGKFVEIQGSSEREPFTPAQLDQMIRLGRRGIRQILALQRDTLRRLS